MKNLPLLLGTLLVTGLLIGSVVFYFSKTAVTETVKDQAVLISDNPHIEGSDNAPVTIVEFSDFQCPACKAAYLVIKQLVHNDSDKIRLIYRHYPLTQIHSNAQLAAQAAEVAAEDGHFWEYHDLLFENQATWSQIKQKSALLEQLASYAEQLGIDKGSFLERINSDHIKSLVSEDVVAGNKLNIKGTPTLYVNGRPTTASQLTEVVESIINN